MKMDSLAEKIRQYALQIGFDLVGFTAVERLPEDERALRSWLGDGHAGEMAYMARDPSRRADPSQSLPEAKTIICLAMNYFPGDHPPSGGSRGRVSRYAWGRDYHRVIEEKLDLLEAFLRKVANQSVAVKRYVDYGPLLERAYASRSGLGFIGKNTMLITAGFGSWVFLAELITNLDLGEESKASRDAAFTQCGSCTLCIDACPTGAIVSPFRLDARRCISYLTIENKGNIPEPLAARMEDWVFGCDVCQEVCPFNDPAAVSAAPEKFPGGAGPWLEPQEILALDERGFKEQFDQTPLLRPKHKGILRNIEAITKNLSVH